LRHFFRKGEGDSLERGMLMTPIESCTFRFFVYADESTTANIELVLSLNELITINESMLESP
jgi:hypothetical protein